MSVRGLPLPLLALILALLLAAACGDDDGVTARPVGQLTDPRTVATATPWAEAPAPILLEPDALTPIGEIDGDGEPQNGGATDGNEDGSGDGGGAAPGDCGETYVVEAGDTPFGIAAKCGVDPDEVSDWVARLLALNEIDDPTTLRVGQELEIPQ